MSHLELFNAHLESLAPQGNDRCSQAVRYALLGSGKRFRPLLTMATVEALGGDISTALAPAAAIEMIHTYSMIHDDLPCMDDDDLRRGKPTLHRAFPEGLAVLAGDWLLTKAFEVLADCPLSDAKKSAMILLLAQAAGGEGMIGGQVLDLEAEGKAITVSELELIHTKKTGALIAASVDLGAIIATGAPHPKLHLFAHHIGLAFQIVDDILDVTEASSKHGRPSDADNDKATYVALMGLEGASAAAEKQIALAESALPDECQSLQRFYAHLAVSLIK